MEVHELATIVERGFFELGGRLDQTNDRLDNLSSRVAGIDDRVAGMDHRLGNVDDRLAGVDNRLHQTQIVVESLRDDLKQVAEGVQLHHKQLERHIADNDRHFEEIHSVFRNYAAARRI